MSPKELVVLINSPTLGGAERSIVQQLDLIKDQHSIRFILPFFEQKDEAEEVQNFIFEYLEHAKISYIKYPRSLYEISREGSLLTKMIPALYGLILILLRINEMKIKSSHLWANGNKIAFPFYLYCRLISFGNKFIWHFRDYPTNRGLFKYIWRLCSIPSSVKFFTISNSYSVKKLVKVLIQNCEHLCVYNITGKLEDLPTDQIQSQPLIIGSASMLVPWKGIHQLILMGKLFEKELKELGVEGIHIYGENIYETSVSNSNYAQELEKLAKGSTMVKFLGKKKPQDIFKEIFILVHCPVKSEPFGRVITEAFNSGTYVISTALGGTSELVENNETGLVFSKYDYVQLFQHVKTIISSQPTRAKLIKGAFAKGQNVNSSVEAQMNRVSTLI